MSSLKHLQQIESINRQLEAQGMRMDHHNRHGAWSSVTNASIVAVYPSEHGLPHYARDAELFVGTLDDVQLWIAGIQWLSNYYNVIGLDNGTKRQTIESKELERQLLESLRTGKQPRLKR